jgi:hypothetical protein
VVWKWKADEDPQPTGSSLSSSSPQEAFDEQGYLLPLNRVECGFFGTAPSGFSLNFMALSPILISHGRPRSRGETQYGLEAIAGVDH